MLTWETVKDGREEENSDFQHSGLKKTYNGYLVVHDMSMR